MKLRFSVSVILFTILLIFSTANIAQAGWSALNSRYAVTTNYHGINTPVGETAIAFAGTTDKSVTKIAFSWLDPNDNEVRYHEVLKANFDLHKTPDYPTNAPQEVINWAANHHGIKVWYAQDSHTPDQVGDWTVKVTFYDGAGHKCHDETKFRATSFFVIDELPLGTIVTLAIPLGFLSFVAIKKKAKTNQPK